VPILVDEKNTIGSVTDEIGIMEEDVMPSRSIGRSALVSGLCCFLAFARLNGQEVEEAALDAEETHVETDRDSFTRSPRVVERRRCVLEGSYSILEQDAEYDGYIFPDLLVRYGTTDWLELRLGWTYEIGKFHHLVHEGAEKVKEGIAMYGAKVALTSADGWRPASTLIGTGYTPTSGESNDTDFSLEYAAGWELPNRWEFDAGLRWFSLAEEEDRFTEWAPSVVLKTPLLSERANAHVEYFSLLSVDREEEYQQHYIGPGSHYLLTPNCEIGARVFWGLNEDSAQFICNAGMGVRF